MVYDENLLCFEMTHRLRLSAQTAALSEASDVEVKPHSAHCVQTPETDSRLSLNRILSAGRGATAKQLIEIRSVLIGHPRHILM